MDNLSKKAKNPLVYKLVVAGMALLALCCIIDRFASNFVNSKGSGVPWWHKRPLEGYHPLENIRITPAYKLVVAGMTVSAMNVIIERLGISSKPIEPKDIVGWYVSPPGLDEKPMLPGANFRTSNFAFIFRSGKLYLVMNMKTNIEEVEHYREWANTPSLIESNQAYHLATNWLSRVFVDVPTFTRISHIRFTRQCY